MNNFYLLESSPDVGKLKVRLTDHLTHFSRWSKKNRLKISPEKSSVTLFAPWNREINFHPEVKINGVLIPLNKNPKPLDISISSMFRVTPHGKNTCSKFGKRIHLMKAIRGRDWGDKETLKLTYNAFCKPVVLYAAPIYHPSLDPKSKIIAKMQALQNNTMRIITGVHKMAD
jgi:hypothetical protein